MKVNIGDTVTLVAPSGATKDVVVTDVIRDWDGSPAAIEFSGVNGPTTLPATFFKTR